MPQLRKTLAGWLAGCTLSLGMVSLVQAQPTGWRGDGSGRFETAQPPTQWSQESENIVWKVEVGGGYSSPVLSGGRLFLTAQPSDVVCIDAESGQELWRQAAGYAAALGEQEAARIAEKQAQLEAEKKELGKQQEALRKSNPDSPELELLNERRQAIDKQRQEFEREFPPEKRGGAGNAAATIACDGKRVFALFGTGILAAFDVDGDRLWIQRLEAPQQGFGHSASPVLASGHLIVHIEQLKALDPATGEAVWSVDLPAKFGTPIVTRIAGQEVLITPSGALVVANEGKVLTEKQFGLSNNSPLVHDGVLYAHEGGEIKAFRLPATLQTPLKLELLWETSATRDQRMASAVYHDGLLYGGGRRGIMEVIDAETGNSVYRKRLDIGELFASPTLAGGYLYYGGKDGQTLVLRPGRKYDEVAINASERINATPLFAGRRMYLRADRSLYCIEAGEAGAE
ncbi:outer membrane protein assembly factor BamB family protein [Lignipirellula cremea]|uniref:Outer membrane biogenesis protein BamB n=1 Tax=Lignipirellula cremea TaxID=2528010 RepID=A0A518DKT9_9BACT|nr:PQQ-binding-like beta-propeller repeat protein [Lignipirellula cremea]QDU92446.1 outer membrane biogenesis protein BamB [Lignipirellula cremea]